MSGSFVTLLIGVGAGAIALWIDVRFPRLAPSEIGTALVHVAASVAVGYASGPAMHAVNTSDDSRTVLVAVFGIGFPAVVYCLLAGLWLIKAAQRTLSGHLR